MLLVNYRRSKRQPGTVSSRGAEAAMAGCRTVGASQVQCVGCTASALGEVQQVLCRGWEKGSVCWEDDAFPWSMSAPQRLLLPNCKGRAFSVVGGDS